MRVIPYGDIADRVKRAAQYAGKEPQDFITDFCVAVFQSGMCG